MKTFEPYEMIWNEPQKDYINSTEKEVFFSGGNQIGKSAASCAMLVFHLTGNYPDWYTGRRFENPPRVMIIGETFNTARDLLIRKIIGSDHEEGAIQKDPSLTFRNSPMEMSGHSTLPMPPSVLPM